MSDDDSDKDKKKQSLLSHGTPAPGTAAPRGGGSLLSAKPAPEEDDPVARHRAARSRREAAPSPLLSALAAMEGFRAAPVTPDEPEAAPAIEPQSAAEEEPASRWSLRNLLSPKVEHDKPEPKPAARARRPIPAAPVPSAADEAPAEEPVEQEPAEPVAQHYRASEPEYAGVAAQRYPDEVDPRPLRSAPDDPNWQPLIDPLTVIGSIGRSKALILTTTVIGALIGVAIALSTPKKYEAYAKLIVDPRDLKVSDRNLTETGLPSDATLALIENQVVVLTSGKVLNQVVDKLKLYEDPEFNGQREGSGIGDIIGSLRALISGGQSGGGDDRRHALAVSNLAESLSVEREGKTFVVIVGATTEDPEKSALIVNTVKDVFLQTTGKLQSETADRAATELGGRLEELRATLDEAERKAERFRAEHDLIDAQGRLISDDEMVKLNEQLSIARAHTIELNARAASARTAKVDSVITGAFPEALSSAVMSELRSQYSAMKQQADQLSVQLGPRHPQHLAMQAQLEGARGQISTELRRIVASVETERMRAIEQEQGLAARLAQLKVRATDVNSDLVTMRELEREAAAKRAVYENYLLRAREAGEQSSINTANITVISDAYPPLESTGPSRATIALGGALLGFIVGIGLGMLRGILASLRESGAARRRQREPMPRSAYANADPLGVEATTAEAPTDAPPVEAAAEEPDMKPREANANPFVRLMQRFRSPPIVTGDSGPAATGPAFDPAANAPADMPANQEPAPMHNYPQQPPTYPGQPQQQPAYGQQPQPYPHAVPYPPQALQPAPYMPQQPLPPYPPAFVQPHPYHPHAVPQPYGYGYPPAYPGWQPQPGMAYGYPQPAAPAYPAYPPMQPQPAAYPQDARPMSQPAPGPREMSPLEEVRESLREFREAIRDLTEERARRRVS